MMDPSNDSAGDGPPPAPPAGVPVPPPEGSVPEGAGPNAPAAGAVPDPQQPPPALPVADTGGPAAAARDPPAADLYLTISPGRLGITVQFESVAAPGGLRAAGGAVVTRVDPHCSFGDRVSPGDRLVSIDGRPVTEASDLSAGSDGERLFGFALVSSRAAAGGDGVAEGGAVDVREEPDAPPPVAEVDAADAPPPETVTVPPGPLGVEVRLSAPGRAVVVSVDGSGTLSGVLSAGDAILAVNGMPVERPDDLDIGTGRERRLEVSRRAVPEADGKVEEDAAGDAAMEVEEEDAKPPAPPEGGEPEVKADAPSWEERYEELRRRVVRTGDAAVPQREEGGLGSWLKNQRQRAGRGELSEERAGMLAGLGVTWTAPGEAEAEREATWEERCGELAAFYEEHGHFRVPREDERLRRWMDKQRSTFEAGKLSEDRAARLEAIGFDPAATKQVTLDERLEQLQAYRARAGHQNVPVTDPVLGRWMWHQRNDYRRMSMSGKRVRRLEAAGFDWMVDWNDRMEQLASHAAAHGGVCDPPPSDPFLGGFAANLRAMRDNRELSQDAEARLNAIGFRWSHGRAGGGGGGPYQAKLTWEDRLERLRRYKIEHGRDRDPPRSHPELGNWVDNQRRFKKKGKLSAERAAALDSVGLGWGAVKRDPGASWDEQYAELAEYRRRHGDCNVKQSHTGLGRFVHWQRCVNRRGKMDPSRRARLDELGFNWGETTNGNQKWHQRYEELKQYKEEHGDVNVHQKHPGGLGAYVKSQRQQHKRGKLSDEKVALLNGLGMEWTPKFHVDYEIRIPPGTLGLTFLQSEKTNGARIASVEPSCPFGDKVGAGDRIMTVDGVRLGKGEEVPPECDRERVLGVAKKRGRAPRKAAAAKEEEAEDGGVRPPPLEGGAAEVPLAEPPEEMEGVEKQEETEDV